MMRRIHRILLLFALLIGGVGMSYVQAANVTLTVTASPAAGGQVRIANGAWTTSTNGTTSRSVAQSTPTSISAQAASGYTFSKWSDNNTNATRAVQITKNTTYTAYFIPNSVTLTVTSNNINYGTVTGGGTYNYNTSVTLTATPKTGYHFVQWSDGNKNASRTVTVTANASYQATFAANQYTIKFVNNGTTLQTLTVNHGVKPSYTGSTPTKTATAQYTYTFSGWSPTIVAATADATYTAQFSSTVRSYTIRFLNGSSVLQSSSVKYGTTPSYTGSTPTKASTAQYSYTFSGWSPAIYAVNKAQDYAAQFSSTVRSYKITGASANTNMGTVSGTATKQYGQTVTLTATPKDCYKFVQWNDGNTSNPRTVTVTAAKTYTATFEENTYSGNCGATGNEANVQWSLNMCTGTLSITGTGAMKDYNSNSTPWDSYRASIKSITIANGVTHIGSSSFHYCAATSVTIPSSVITIGDFAFFRCASLTSINIPSSVTTINFEAFMGCSSLTSVTIPNSVTGLGMGVFEDCTSLTSATLSNSITTIPSGLFVGCSALTSVKIPNGVTLIDGYAFAECSSLPSVTIPNSVTMLGYRVLYKCTSLKDIYVSWTTPDAIPEFPSDIPTGSAIRLHIPCGTKSIYQAPSGWKSYTHVEEIAAGTCGTNLTWVLECDSTLRISGTGDMTNFGNSSQPWKNISHLIKHVVIEEGVTSIGNNAFYQMDIVTVTNPSTLKTIGLTAFYRCHQLERINFPNGMTSIGNSVTGHGPFYECTSLKAIYIPASLTFINSDTFLRCYSLTSIVVDPANPKYDSRDNCNAIIETATNKLWYGCQTTVIPDGVKTVAQFAFEYQHNLKSIRISNTVNHFEISVFRECENLKDIYVEWTTTPPQDVLTSWYEHENLDATITIHVPCGYESLYSSSSAWNRYQIVDDHLKGGMCGAQGSNQTWMLSCDGHLEIKGIGAMANYSAGGAPWYEYKDAIHTVTFADGINTIGENAFAGFTNLTDIYAPWTENIPVLPASNNPQSSVTLHIACSAISDYQAAGWGNYTVEAEYTASGTCGAQGSNVTWTYCGGVLTISGTGAMKNYTYADANTVPWYYFRTYNITSIVIEEGVTDIGDYVFFGCSSVTSVTIPNSVTSIGNAAFRNCSSLASITIPETVLTIGNLAFYSCPALTSITFPNSVTSIGNAALNYCSALEDIYVSWTENIPTWISMTNRDPQPSITLHVPCGTDELYNAANGWKDYTIEADIPNVKSGTYGPDNIEWTFDYCDSLLTITGNGELLCDENTWGPNAGGINPNAVKNVFIGKGVTYLGIYTLSYMTNIEYIEIEEGHPTHRTGCNAIIRIGSEQEGDTLIFGCPHTVIPTTCTTIRGYAFWDNHHVTEMTIPSSVKQIANMQGSLWQGNNGQVFYTSNSASEGLKDLYVEWTKLEDIPAVPNNRLGDMTKVRLHVPCGTTSLYKQVTGWSKFKEYIEESATFTITVQAEDPTMGDVSIVVN